MQREQRRWVVSPLGNWINNYGASKVATDVDVHPNTVYEWLAGRGRPTFERALKIVELSGGSLTVGDIYAHRALVKPEQ